MNVMRDVVELIRSEMSDLFLSVENDAEYLRSEAALRAGSGQERGGGHHTANTANRVVFRSSQSSGGIIFNFLTGLYPSAYKTSTILRAYMDLDERARVLAFCLRYLAKVKSLTKVHKKKLPLTPLF